jgi:hypothetical protein
MFKTELVLMPTASWAAFRNLAVQAMPAEASKRVYSAALDHFHEWYFAEPRATFSRTVVQQYRTVMEKDAYAPATVAIHISALRKLAEEAADNGLLDPQTAAGVCSIRGPRRLGRRLGNWWASAKPRR